MNLASPAAPRFQKAVIFDLDGVLINSEPWHYRAAEEIFKKYGHRFTPQMHREFIGMGDAYCWSTMVRRFKIPHNYAVLMAEKVKLYRTLVQQHAQAIPGVLLLLQQLQGKVILGVASSSVREEVELILCALKINHFFGVVVSGDEVHHSKPHPEIYLAAAQRARVHPAHCVAVEDALHGIAAAKAAGMKCVGITTSFPRIELLQADHVIDTFAQFQLQWVL